MTKENSKSVSIEIPSALAEKLKREGEKAGYSNLSDYVTHLLRKGCPSAKDDSSLNPEEEKKIEKRLKDLGYID